MSLITLVVPVYNESAGLAEFHERARRVLDALPAPFRGEILFVNDGSKDNTADLIRAWQAEDASVGLLDLSRNFGKEIALTAGLDHAAGDIVIVIDADLQDPPELIPQLLEKWQAGYDVVYAVRSDRLGESWVKRKTAHVFYRIMQRVAPVPADTGDFRLLSRRAVVALRTLREQHRFMKGLFSWIGYRQIGVPFVRQPRQAGQTKWSYWKLWNLALEGISSFTTFPLKIATYVGLLTSFGAFVFGAGLIWETLRHGNPVPGYPSLMVVMLFLGGIQLMSLGVIGEYLGRTFDESKRRPLYLVAEHRPARLSDDAGVACDDGSAAPR